MLTKMTSGRDYKSLILICLAAVILLCGYACYTIIYKDTPKPQMEVTDKAIGQAREENTAALRRLDELEKTVKKEVQVIRVREREYVDSLPPDAVAAALTDELRIFLDGGQE